MMGNNSGFYNIVYQIFVRILCKNKPTVVTTKYGEPPMMKAYQDNIQTNNFRLSYKPDIGLYESFFPLFLNWFIFFNFDIYN